MDYSGKRLRTIRCHQQHQTIDWEYACRVTLPIGHTIFLRCHQQGFVTGFQGKADDHHHLLLIFGVHIHTLDCHCGKALASVALALLEELNLCVLLIDTLE